MENKINIAQLLKNCPKGMELDCTMWENVTLKSVVIDDTFPIKVAYPTDGDTYTTELTKYGGWSNVEAAKCVIFPKGKTSWEGFVPPCKFKVGDRIRKKGENSTFTITDVNEAHYFCGKYVICDTCDNNWELVPYKFDINTLKPFDKVLTRDNDSQKWDAELFSFYNNESEDYHFQLVGVCSARYCIPYEENKHLLGTTNDCDDFYKTWE